MLLFLSRNRKFLSLFFLVLFFFSSNHYGNYLIVEAVKLTVGITIDDYKCKDHNCGCTTAFKCLTDCCCTFDEPEEFSIICNPVPLEELEVMNCCSKDAQSTTPLQNKDEGLAKPLSDKTRVLLPSSCSADEYFSYQVSQGFLLDISYDQEYSQEFLTESEWFSKQSFTFQTVSEDLLKVPILG